MRRYVVAGAVLCLLITTNAQAQTAADTALFLVTGDEHAPLDASSENHSHREMPCPNNAQTFCAVDRVFKKIDDCRFEMKMHYSGEGDSFDTFSRYDFSKIGSIVRIEIDKTMNKQIYKIYGAENTVCSTVTGLKPWCDNYIALIDTAYSRIDLKRLRDAIAYLKSNFCEGSAF